jgi:hypothetical protein
MPHYSQRLVNTDFGYRRQGGKRRTGILKALSSIKAHQKCPFAFVL